MAAIIQLRRYSLGVLIFLFIPVASGREIDRRALPVLTYLGVIPLSPEPDSFDDPAIKSQLGQLRTLYSHSVRETNRFRVLDDRLIEDMWKDPESRRELREEHELSAFTHFEVILHPDKVIFTVRLLSPDMKLWLQESDVHPLNFFRKADTTALHKLVYELIARMINRIPVDVHVTSVQGKYITLSGGMRQGLSVGDQIDLVRVFVSSLHPALGTWRTFDSVELGQATVVESGDKASIAALTYLIRGDSVRPGDGAKSLNIASRSLFSARKAVPEASGKHEGLLLNDRAADPKMNPYKSEEAVIPLPPGFSDRGSWMKSQVGEPVSTHDKAEVETKQSSGKEMNLEEEGTYLPDIVEAVRAKFGYKGFSYSGPGATGSQLLWYQPVNVFGLELKKGLVPKVVATFGGEFLSGKTQRGRGSYLGYGAYATLFWEDQATFVSGDVIRRWRFGAHGFLTGLGVSREGFGGFDLFQSGILLGMDGRFYPDRQRSPWLWLAEFRLTPLTFGRIGYGNSRNLIKSSFGWDLVFAAYLPGGEPDQLQWGGSLDYGVHSFYDDSGRAAGFSVYEMSALLRWAF
ncbi:MAG: hypothetical protein H6618_01885 [Deltaproteobacteria bacterium]|nr:hypothetical protein [Deltaproteobacteria bacterium]